MKKIAILVFISIIGISLISIPQHTQPIDLKIGTYSLWTSQFALGLRNDSPPGAFYTISPFDDLVIYEDGTEAKVITSNDIDASEPGQRKTIAGYILQLFTDTKKLSTQTLNTEYISNSKKNSLVYELETLGSTVAVTRTAKTDSQEKIIGLGQSLIYNEGDQLLVDNTVLSENPNVKQEGKYLTLSGVSKVTIQNPQFTSFLTIQTKTSDTVVIDPDLRLLTIKTFLEKAEKGPVTTVQIIEIHQ